MGRIVFCLLLIIMLATGCSSGAPGSGKLPPGASSGGENSEQNTGQSGQGLPPLPSENTENANSSNPASSPSDPVEQWLNKLSTEEKIGQMVLLGLEGTTPDETVRSFIQDDHVGGFIFYKDNIRDVKQAQGLFNDLKQMNRENAQVPLLLSVDEEGGKVSRMPQEIDSLPTARKIGDAHSEELARQIGGMLGRELADFGLNMNFAPVLDVNSNPDNPVIGNRAFGTKPDIVSQMGIAVMKGIREQGVIPVVKHFPGHGDTSVDSHLGLPVVEHDLTRLRDLELIPFTRAVDEGADVVMIAHLLLPRLDSEHPASFSQVIIHDLLRQELGFAGVVISDDMTMGAITEHYDIGEAAVQFIQAGGNIVLVGHDYDKGKQVLQAIRTAVEEGEIPPDMLNQRVYSILELKRRYELDDEAAKGPDSVQMNKDIRKLLQEYQLK
ncbi:beta-N-acetylhexosaminidase [Paenibacillus sanguinis]|uniref:beta-N-acetylhexosaminidase n=1 Tax=Paenibacillus sanguinis TaxID=225906 RepID=UPI000592C0E8|nr:beta-N-acetylhexosaminidase [Paenibacillus sanguinis]